MSVFLSIDEILFRFLNQKLANPVFDVLMPFLSGNKFFLPASVIIVLLLVWCGGCKGRVYVLVTAILLGLGEPVLCGSLKNYFQRQRPFVALADTRQPGTDKMSTAQATIPEGEKPPAVPRRVTYSMPSAHAFNFGALTMVTFIYYRRSWPFMVPRALAVAYSRVYNGVHYPSDVLVGLILGAAYGFSGRITLNRLCGSLGKRLFPISQHRLPNLALPKIETAQTSDQTASDT